MKQEQLKNQSRIRTATKEENAENIISITPVINIENAREEGEEKKKADLRLIPKKYRAALYAKKAEMELGVINKVGNVLSQETVTLTALKNAATVEENAITSSEIFGRFVPKQKGKGLDTRFLTKLGKLKYNQADEAAQAELDRKINEKIANSQTISNDDYLEILTMAKINPFGDKFVSNEEEAQKKKNDEFEIHLKGSSLEIKAD